MTITYGLTAAGFVNKPLPVIRDDINAALRAVFGSSVDLSDRSVLGIIVGILSERLSLLWELLETITGAMDPSKATGSLLEAIAALTGTLKAPATHSLVTLTLTGTASTLVQAGSRALTLSTGKAFETLADATFEALSDWTALTTYALGDRVTNDGSVYQNIQAGDSAASGGPSGVDTDLTPDGDCLWTFLGGGGAAADTDAEAVAIGPVFATAGDITQIGTPVGGWVAVTNLESASPGVNIASDSELRLLRELELANAGSATADALTANLLDVSGVFSVSLFVNNTDLTDADSVPPHAVEALIRGGDDQDIFSALFGSIAAGIATFGNQSGVAVDSQGTTHTLKFSRPTEVSVYVSLLVTTDVSSFPSDGDDQIASAIVTYGDQQTTGRDAVAAAVASRAFTVAGVLDVTSVLIYTDVIGTSVAWQAAHAYVATVGSRSVVTNGGRSYICITGGTSAGSGGPTTTATDITDGTAHWRFLGSNITMAARELAVFTGARVSVTSTPGTP